MMIVSRWIFAKFGWGMAALITPTVLLLTGERARAGKRGRRAGRGAWGAAHGAAAITCCACASWALARALGPGAAMSRTPFPCLPLPSPARPSLPPFPPAPAGVVFFALVLFSGPLTPGLATLGLTPLYAAVLVGAAQNIFSKSSKYSLFDPCKEMAYIPLDSETKVGGWVAVCSFAGCAVLVPCWVRCAGAALGGLSRAAGQGGGWQSCDLPPRCQPAPCLPMSHHRPPACPPACLPPAPQTKGKAAIDVICNPLGKSGGALIQQFMIIGFGSLAASTPYLGLILLAVVCLWLFAAKVRAQEGRAELCAQRSGVGWGWVGLGCLGAPPSARSHPRLLC